MSIQIIKNPWSQAFSGVGSALGSALEQRGKRSFEQMKLAQQRALDQKQKEEERKFRAGESSLERDFKAGESTLDRDFRAGESTMERASRLGLKQAEFQEKRDVAEEDRTRLAQSGTILESVLTPLGSSPSLPQLGNAYSSYLEQGGDPDLWKQAFAPYEPQLKEQARTEASQSLLAQILGSPEPSPQIPGDPSLPQQQIPGQNPPPDAFTSQESMGVPEGTIYSKVDGVPEGITNKKIEALHASPIREHQELGKLYEGRRKESYDKWSKERDFNTKGLEPTEKKIEDLREILPRRERVLNLARLSIESGEIGALSQNRIANIIGGPVGDALKTMSGAQFAVASKENLVTNMSEISARGINIFMEKNLLDAFGKVGQTQEANLAVQDFFEAENDIQKAYLSAYDELGKQDMQRYGFRLADLGKRAREASQPEQQKIFNRSSVRLRGLQEREKGVPWMYKQTGKKVVKGTPLTSEMYRIFIEKVGDPQKALVRAKQLGYTIYPPSELPGGGA